MRNRGPSKQRLWLGAGRYFCCGGRKYTDTDTHCYSDGDRHANCNSIGNGHAAADANTKIRANGKAASHASAEAIEFRGTDSWC
jgi:hypothetical protein